ncbi:2-amino-4-hydroxy-6-hydroxymethyldihydropteridine diphosphokinase [Cyclobacterium plantarum]|uniref:2-amino-4-hydroxy-6-hydroxymethyldihydropteridine pyrophosphokinase n=1 Tax=Cyclobacterium plantarum TaxID=2716263 RepID=A0ABX0H3J4_9BACT|nr:2-amino-4-hydroxy-6-hydroxymethyldihydropteridine diphosphokinase [Cyclobacterium plantarum]NHE55448.1 2-amino-4-hydroxy-6-hydroxymethyldihydropteridine diphosphokinase [Cyclobacterium plantarum]
MHRVVLSLGGNVGDRLALIRKALELLVREMKLLHASQIYETAAWGGNSEAAFLNQVLVLHTSMDAESTLDFIQEIENRLGRKRVLKWGDRTMDIDILYFDNSIIQTDRLQVPHRLMLSRNFILIPLAEILPEEQHPVNKLTHRELLERCEDRLTVRPVSDG